MCISKHVPLALSSPLRLTGKELEPRHLTCSQLSQVDRLADRYKAIKGSTKSGMGQSWGSKESKFVKLQESLRHWVTTAYDTAKRSTSKSLPRVEGAEEVLERGLSEMDGWVDHLRKAWE